VKIQANVALRSAYSVWVDKASAREEPQSRGGDGGTWGNRMLEEEFLGGNENAIPASGSSKLKAQSFHAYS